MGNCKKKRAQKAARRAGSDAENFGQHVKEAAEQGLEALTTTVVPAVSQGAKEAGEKAQEFFDKNLPAVKDSLQSQADKLGPRAEKLRTDVVEDYLPRARRTADTTNAVAKSAVVAAVEAARKELDKGQGDIRKAATEPTKKKGRGGRVALLLALTAAGAAAGYVVWKRTRPVEDPWAPPADFARAHYPASESTETDSTTVSDVVGGAEAGDVAQSLKGDKGDHNGDTTPHDVKVDHATGDAKSATHRGTPKPEDAKKADGAKKAGDVKSAGAKRPAGSVEKEEGRVIDPVLHPEENPADPANDGKNGSARKDG